MKLNYKTIACGVLACLAMHGCGGGGGGGTSYQVETIEETVYFYDYEEKPIPSDIKAPDYSAGNAYMDVIIQTELDNFKRKVSNDARELKFSLMRNGLIGGSMSFEAYSDMLSDNLSYQVERVLAGLFFAKWVYYYDVDELVIDLDAMLVEMHEHALSVLPECPGEECAKMLAKQKEGLLKSFHEKADLLAQAI